MAASALLVLDMLKDFILPEGSLFIGEVAPKLVEKVGEELAKARREGLLVIYICDHHFPDDREFDMFPPHCTAFSLGAEIVDSLAPIEGEIVVYKRRYSGFFATDLDLCLREKGVDKLLLTGVCTNICVLYTAHDAMNFGYEVELIKDAVASFDDKGHQWALKEMEKTLGVKIVESF